MEVKNTESSVGPQTTSKSDELVKAAKDIAVKDYPRNRGFNKENIYNHDILPILKKLLVLCNEHEIPIFIDMAIKNSPAGTVYKTEFLSARSFGLRLKEDRLTKHALVANGFSVYIGESRPYLENAAERYGEDLEDPHDITGGLSPAHAVEAEEAEEGDRQDIPNDCS